MTLRAAIFDLDGTLLDTIEDLTDSMNAALSALGYPVRTVAECRNLVGDGLATYILRALPEKARHDEAAFTRLGELMRAEYRVRQAVKTKPYPGVAAMLGSLTAKGIPHAVLSNKPHPATVEVVARFFPGHPFRIVQGARDGGPVKPDPSGALEIARQLDIPPAEILYLGDTNTDMKTARAAGMFAVGALWGFRTRDELLANGAQALAARPADIPTYFQVSP
ncbi:MAG: HAD family hydrolase [Acidobacteriota bacterium]|nr:HAD family hydrolase [Acidobacteriota bacterium]